jgi:RND family efflux transporter MFP subunit
MMKSRIAGLLLLGIAAAACGSPEPAVREQTGAALAGGPAFEVAMASRTSVLEASGTAGPWAEATLSTRLMGSVLEVTVREGDRVRRGQPLVRIDARDLDAKAAQVAASLAEAEANHQQAFTHAGRMRDLFAKEAAPRALLDAAETALASAEARGAAARAAAEELAATRDYAVVRAPFDGVLTARMVDPGAFAAPGTPLVTVQDFSRLRLSASVAPAAVRNLGRGDTIGAAVEGVETAVRVEGIVPEPGGNVYTVNATLDNRAGRFLAGSAATLSLPQGERVSIVVPASAVVRQGDLTGVRVLADGGAELRWVRVVAFSPDSVEVLAGLRAGERIAVTASAPQVR